MLWLNSKLNLIRYYQLLQNSQNYDKLEYKYKQDIYKLRMENEEDDSQKVFQNEIG